MKMTPLRDSVKRVSDTKGLSVKQIVNLCECSRSHFYKVLDGQRLPSDALQNKLMQVLEIDKVTLEALIEATQQSKEQLKNTKVQGTNQKHLQQYKINSKLFAYISVLLISAIAYLLFQENQLSNSQQVELQTGFATKFIKDVTIPDGTPIAVNTRFTKTWRVQNIGSVPWQDKRLKRMTPQDPNLCYSVDSIALPTVKPGEIIDISIEFTTPRYPGTCRTDWKMVDTSGNLIFPAKKALYSIVHVVEEKL